MSLEGRHLIAIAVLAIFVAVALHCLGVHIIR